jgi:hypothetical protein
LLSKLPLSSYEEFLVFSLALRARLFTIDFSPDKFAGAPQAAP